MDFISFFIFFILLPTGILYILKPKFINFELFFILLKFEKAMWIFDFFAKRWKNFWYTISEYGIVLGFGIFGTFYLKEKGIKPTKCLLYQIIHTIISFILIILITGQINIIYFIVFSLFGSSFFMILLIGEKAINILHDYYVGVKIISPGLAPILPKETGIKFKNNPIQIPLYAFIVLIIIVIVHELFHGILCRIEKIRLKSYGLLFLGLLPAGAFVEPDEEELKKTESLKKNRMFSAGSMGNMLIFLICLSLLIIGNQIITHIPNLKYGVVYNITNVENNLSNIKIGNIYYWFLNPNEKFVVLKDIENNKTIKLNLSYEQFLGSIEYDKIVYPKNNYLVFLIMDLLKWGALLSLMVGLINYLPLLIFDGARMLDEIIKTLYPNHRNRIITIINITLIILFIINILPLFI